MSGNLLVRFDEGRVGRTASVALSPTLPSWRASLFQSVGNPRDAVLDHGYIEMDQQPQSFVR